MESKAEILNLSDDGHIPNSKYPVIIYHGILEESGEHAALFLENRFAENGWSNSFRWRVYDYHHYHSNTHEVLGVYAGTAELQLGGPGGEKLQVKPGEVIILPAGTGHISLQHSLDFAVVGAYPDGKEPDLIRLEDPRPDNVQQTVDSIPVPGLDPVYGSAPDALLSSWKESPDR